MAGFATDNRQPGTPRRLLLQIQLRDPYNRRDNVYSSDPGQNPTLYLCDGPGGPQEFGAIEAFGITYYPMIEPGWVFRSASGGLGENVTDPDGRFVIRNIRYPWQKVRQGGATAEASLFDVHLDQVFQEWVAEGSLVTAFLATLPHYTVTPGTMARGVWRIASYKAEGNTIEVVVGPRNEYSTPLPNTVRPSGFGGSSIITRVAHPNAPDDSINEMIPEVYCSTPNLDLPFTSEETLLAISPRLLANLAPMALTSVSYNSSGAGSVARVFANKHESMGTTIYSFVTYLHVPELDTLAAIIDGVQTIGSREHYFDIAASPKAQVWLNPVEIYSQVNITNVDRAFDGKATTAASLDQATSVLQLIVPSVSPLGKISQLKGFVVLQAGTGIVGNCAKMGVYSPQASVPGYFAGASKTLVKAEVETAGIYYSGTLTADALAAANLPSWQWSQPRTPPTAPDPIVFRVENLAAGVSTKVVACGFFAEFTPESLRTNVRRERQWTNQYDVNGRRVGRRAY